MKKVFSLLFFVAVSFFSVVSIACTNLDEGAASVSSSSDSLVSVKNLVCDDVALSDFTGGVYCKKDFVFSGSLQEGKSISSVVAQIKWGSEASFSDFAKAQIVDRAWTCEFSLKGEGVAFIRFVAQESSGTFLNADSARIITLFVSDSVAVENPWFINRGNGNQFALKSLEELKSLDLNLPQNKDAAQNDFFAISVTNLQVLPVKITSAAILTEDGESLCTVENANSSDYEPSFKITRSLLKNASEDLDSGKHYLKVVFNAEYASSNAASEFEIDGGYFLWWQEYDIPKILNSHIIIESAKEILNLSVDESLSLDIFDDDELSEVYCALLTEEEAAVFEDIDWSEIAKNPSLIASAASDEERTFSFSPKTLSESSLSVSLSLPDSAQTMRLLAIAFDSSEPQQYVTKDVEVRVMDEGVPVLSINSPKSFTVPQVVMNGSKAIFKIEGKVFDKVGCSALELSWIPKNDSVENVWQIPLSKAVSRDSFYEQSFFLSLDLLSDFEDEADSDKSFRAKITRNDGKASYVEYNLLADSDSPQILTISPQSESQVAAISEDFTIEFSASKESGLAIDASKYKIYAGDEEIEGAYDEESGTYKATISAETLKDCYDSDSKLEFALFAADIFGNEAQSSVTIVPSSLPTVKNISFDASKPYVEGDEISITVEFSSAVELDSLVEENLSSINLRGITNRSKNASESDSLTASYKSGSGTQFLVFSYVVQSGDECESLTVFNDTFSFSKEIKIDAVSPECEDFSITTSATSSNKFDGITYLKEGRTLSVTITASKTVYIEETENPPTFDFSVVSLDGAESVLSLPLASCSNKIITFSKKIAASDPNGTLFYDLDSCISNGESLRDGAGNVLSFSKLSSAQKIDSKIMIDTALPSVPKIVSEDGAALAEGLYSEPVSFKVEYADSDFASVQYSTDGGSSWSEYAAVVTQAESAQVSARVIDRAGNISETESSIGLNINGSFPSFSVESLSGEGNYKLGSTVLFRVNFASKVSVKEKSQAKIRIAPYKYAKLKDSAQQDEVTSLTFAYTVASGDDFSPKVEKTGVILSDVTDLYGNSQKETDILAEVKDFSGIVCDGTIPTVSKMLPSGETKAGSNIFKNGNEITIVFSEEVKKSSGKITLRQTKGWAIPPVLSESQFTAIMATLSQEDKEILSRQDSAKNANLEDSESIFSAKTANYPNDTYHGTGVDVGPYKKSTHGLAISEDDSFVPDLSTKYVLDFDIDIWETETEHYYDKTFETGFATKKKYADRVNFDSMANSNVFKIVEPQSAKNAKAKRTASQIREVLEKAQYHERVIAVDSDDVEIAADGKTVTVHFARNPYEESDSLPYGREWELAIEKDAFVDMRGNGFGVSENSDFVVVKNANGKSSFWSENVAAPVVRVDRYSYGLGIWQSDENGNKASQIVADLSTVKLEKPHDSVTPTGYVRVRIDCETKGVSINYAVVEKQLASSDVASLSLSKSSPASNGETVSPVFAAGNGDYKKGSVQYIVARASKNGVASSESGIEAVFQTVVQFVNPKSGAVSSATLPLGQQDLSIHGGIKGEIGDPSVSSFPLRISQNGSPYLRRCYRENTDSAHLGSKDYYWLSYEILTDTVFSYYNWNSKFYSWSDKWGVMKPGELSRME